MGENEITLYDNIGPRVFRAGPYVHEMHAHPDLRLLDLYFGSTNTQRFDGSDLISIDRSSGIEVDIYAACFRPVEGYDSDVPFSHIGKVVTAYMNDPMNAVAVKTPDGYRVKFEIGASLIEFDLRRPTNVEWVQFKSKRIAQRSGRFSKETIFDAWASSGAELAASCLRSATGYKDCKLASIPPYHLHIVGAEINRIENEDLVFSAN